MSDQPTAEARCEKHRDSGGPCPYCEIERLANENNRLRTRLKSYIDETIEKAEARGAYEQADHLSGSVLPLPDEK